MKRSAVVLLLLLLICNAVDAKTFRENTAFTQLKQNILLDENQSAWQLALLLEPEHLGDVDFDFLYGIIALKVAENERAVYAFERVVANKPQWLDAQYYLASAYYAIKNYHAAIEITQSLSQLDNISFKLRDSAQKLNSLANSSLNKQSLYVRHSVDINLGYDSNINAGTNEDNIFLPFLNEDIILSDNSKEMSDNYLALGYQMVADKTLTQSSKLTFTGTSQLHYFADETDFNRFYIDSNLQYRKAFDGFNANVGARVAPLWLNDSYYRTQYGATIGLNKVFDKHWLIETEAFFGKTKNDINRQLNTDDISGQISVQYMMAKWRHSFSLMYLQETSEFSESQHNDSKTNALTYMLDLIINQQWLASANISFQHQAYQYEHPFYFEKRVDDMWLFNTAIQYQGSKNWSYRLSAAMQDKDSNLALFSYQRVNINLSARLRF